MTANFRAVEDDHIGDVCSVQIGTVHITNVYRISRQLCSNPRGNPGGPMGAPMGWHTGVMDLLRR